MKKILLLTTFLFFLTGCSQYSAMIGPSITLVETGSVLQASTSYGSSYTLSIARKNISDYEINSEAMPLVKSFMLRTLFSLFIINALAIFLVKFDPNMPEGITESMRIYPMIMHAVLAILPIIVLIRMSSKIK